MIHHHWRHFSSCHYNFIHILGTITGVLKNKYTRVEISPCSESLLDFTDLWQERLVTLREAAVGSSVFGSRGYKHCHCKTGCLSNYCKYEVSGKLCTSRCHAFLSSLNKQLKISSWYDITVFIHSFYNENFHVLITFRLLRKWLGCSYEVISFLRNYMIC